MNKEGNEVKGWIATRSVNFVWHWASHLSPKTALAKCGVTFDWNESVRPTLVSSNHPEDDFLIELEHGDVMCPDCNLIREWDGLTETNSPAARSLAFSGISK